MDGFSFVINYVIVEASLPIYFIFAPFIFSFFTINNFFLSNSLTSLSIYLPSLSTKIFFVFIFVFSFCLPNIEVSIECWYSSVVLVQFISTKLEDILSWRRRDTWNSFCTFEQSCELLKESEVHDSTYFNILLFCIFFRQEA